MRIYLRNITILTMISITFSFLWGFSLWTKHPSIMQLGFFSFLSYFIAFDVVITIILFILLSIVNSSSNWLKVDIVKDFIIILQFGLLISFTKDKMISLLELPLPLLEITSLFVQYILVLPVVIFLSGMIIKRITKQKSIYKLNI